MTATHAFHLGWAGKALGVAAALILAPPAMGPLLWWLAGGLALGQLVDTAWHRVSAAAAPTERPPPASLEFTFMALGRLARAGGPVRRAHIACAEKIMSRYGLAGSQRRRAIDWFNAGKAEAEQPLPAGQLLDLAERCRDEGAGDPAALSTVLDAVLESLCRMALAEDTPARREALETLGAMLGFPPATVADRYRRLAEHLALQDARKLLGIGPEADGQAAKTAYRRQVARCHPDRLPATASAGKRKAAEQRMHALREALERIQSASNLSP